MTQELEPWAQAALSSQQAYQRGLEVGRRLGYEEGINAVRDWVAKLPVTLSIVPPDPKVQEASAFLPLDTPIEQLELTVLAHNRLKNEELHTIGDILDKSVAQLLDIRNFGHKCLDELKAKLDAIGYRLREALPEDYESNHA